MNRIRHILVGIFLMCAVPAMAAVVIEPAEPVGGQALHVSFPGYPFVQYQVEFEGKSYPAFSPKDNLEYEVYLPLAIPARGEKTVVVHGEILGMPVSREKVSVIVKKRRIRTVYLSRKSERMRDRTKSVKADQIAFNKLVHHRSTKKMWDDAFMYPLLTRTLSTRFAIKRQGRRYSYYHKGLDFPAREGSPVHVINNGKVLLAHEDFNVYGNVVIVDHGQGLVSCYFHLKKALVKTGDSVVRGQVIGVVGSTGWSTGAHLHLGMYVQGEAIDPIWWISFSQEEMPVNG